MMHPHKQPQLPIGPLSMKFALDAKVGAILAELMNDAMAVMDHAMRAAPMDGVPEHDFVVMMIPHHQGAIDMALLQLKYGRDERLKRLAQSIIVEQGQEIAYMRTLLATPAGAASTTPTSER